ncbi:Uncharacterised protein [Vibrio cholerae]|nr:Uncharacterised protein [Vibrio cholerae]
MTLSCLAHCESSHARHCRGSCQLIFQNRQDLLAPLGRCSLIIDIRI